jgi:EAL domain-containing protein (putative c-di-GMP-specific phosphodiesterase class I)
MSADAKRFLGFAFANADFLIETARDGTILFAAGAAAEFTSKTKLTGSPAADLFEPQDGARLMTGLKALASGGRTRLKLKPKGLGACDVALFRLPDNDGRISLALAREGNRAGTADKDAATGLAAKDGFIADAIDKLGDHDALTLVNMPALPKIVAGMSEDKAEALLADIGRSFIESGAKAAGRLTETSFGAVADARRGPKSQIAGLRAAMAKTGLPPTEIQETHVAMNAPGLRPEQRFLALRYVVERFTSPKKRGAISGNLSQAFESMMDETHERLVQLTSTVKDGAFEMAYQPIVKLKSRELSHFEALARFGPAQTGETIQFAEQLGLADSFDLAVAMKVIKALETQTWHAADVAFNVSGHTVQSPAAFGMLAGLLARHKKLAPRLLIEVTETAEITDTAAAAQAIAALREMGFRVGLDDFGAGAATLNYLHAFPVDFVKFDGSLVKKLGASARDDTLLKAMLKLCRELGYTTIAEYLETEDDAVRACEAGFDDGQGYAFGAAGEIPAGAGMKKVNAKRRGVAIVWK